MVVAADWRATDGLRVHLFARTFAGIVCDKRISYRGDVCGGLRRLVILRLDLRKTPKKRPRTVLAVRG